MFECTGEIKQCLNCPLPDCIRGTVRPSGVKKFDSRAQYYKDWYKAHMDYHIAKVKAAQRRKAHDRQNSQ